ncbi:hypothetical protein CYMTET_25965, partial [Cymbomonas tetramitiformis]
AVDVQPIGGRLVLFYADLMLHEVLETYASRHALTMWYYDKEERQRHVADPEAAAAGDQECHRSTRGSGESDEPGGKGSGMSGHAGAPNGMDCVGVALHLLQEMIEVKHPDRTSVDLFVSKVRALDEQGQEVFAHVMGVPHRKALFETLQQLTVDRFKCLQDGAAKAFGPK